MDNGASSYHRFLSGDKSGLEEIIRFYSDSLTLYICTLVGNIDDAKEIMTETFVELYVKKPKYSGKSTFKTWLYSIARHTAYDFLKSKSKYQYLSDEELNSLPSRCDLEKELEYEAEKKELYKAIDKLKPEYRQVIYLIYIEGFDNSETAEIMKKSKKQTSELLYRAKQSLRKILEKEGDCDEGSL
ncbi:MAG: RNA polymerase sigma factor [Ruminococcus sp.]|nr:RNA polymerase sigma factor [Ruminococcus sp.]